jgi:hypothetical protein
MGMNPNWHDKPSMMAGVKGLGKEEREPKEPMSEPLDTEPVAGGSEPSIFMHSHAKGVTVHIHHPSGKHEKHEHAHGDVAGMKGHIDKHMASESDSGGNESSAPEPGDQY